MKSKGCDFYTGINRRTRNIARIYDEDRGIAVSESFGRASCVFSITLSKSGAVFFLHPSVVLS